MEKSAAMLRIFRSRIAEKFLQVVYILELKGCVGLFNWCGVGIL